VFRTRDRRVQFHEVKQNMKLPVKVRVSGRMSIRRDAPDRRDETIVISLVSGSAASTSKLLQSPIQKCSVHVEIISKSHPEVQRSFGSGSAASTSNLFQSPIQKCSVHSGPEVQRPRRNYFKVPSRSAAFIRVRKCSVHVEIISKSKKKIGGIPII
jgi:hypothetical protein